jgi:putative NADH-flavin reductase
MGLRNSGEDYHSSHCFPRPLAQYKIQLSQAAVVTYTATMQLTVFGASGKVGSLVVEAALRRGFSVVAFTHSRDMFIPSNKMRVIKADIHSATDVAKAVQGSDAVISCLGSWGTKSKDILSSAMENVIPAMEAQGIKRIITLTGGAAFDEKDVLPAGQKIAYKLFSVGAGKIIYDGEQHIKLLRASSLDWTVIRAPVMNNIGRATYKLSNKLPGLFTTIPRQAVANAILDQLDNPKTIHQLPVIYRN